MNVRNAVFTVVGLVVGIIVGAVFMGTNTTLRNQWFPQASEATQEAVFRTVNEAAATSDFYLAELSLTTDWLVSLEVLDAADTAQVDTFNADLAELIANLTTENLATEVADVDSKANAMLKTVYETLVAKRGDENQAIAACIGVEEDIYTGMKIYLYIQIPDGTEKDMGIPKDWKLLDGPLPTTQLWVSECYKEEEEA